MEEAKKKRSQSKRTLTLKINAITRYIAEEKDQEYIEEKKEELKETFTEFEFAHETFTTYIEEEAAKDEGADYFDNVQTSYIQRLRAASDYIKSIREEHGQNGQENLDLKRNSSVEMKMNMDLPKLEIEPFSGDPLKYHSFVAMFSETVEKHCNEDGARLMRLLQYTEGPAKKAIRACAVVGGEAWNILQKRFGHNNIVSEAMTTKLRTKTAAHKGEEIQELADDLTSCFLTLRQTGRLHEIDTQNTINDIIGRLPKYIQSKWRTEAMKVMRSKGAYPGISELLGFIQDTAEEVNDPVYGYKGETKPRSADAKARSVPPPRTYVAQDNPKVRSSAMECQLCNQGHGIWTCDLFAKKAIPERWEIAKQYHLCFRCLGRGHGGVSCRRSRPCGLDGCRSRHHRLLHESKEQTPAPHSPPPPVPEADKDMTMVTSSPLARKEPSFVSLRTVPVYLSNGRRHIKVNALLDEASTKTYLNSDVAAELGLHGDAQELTVNVLNGRQEKTVHIDRRFHNQ